MTYVKIRSWHVVNIFTRVQGGYITRCGRRGRVDPVEFAHQMPLPEKTCETCLRLTVNDEGD